MYAQGHAAFKLIGKSCHRRWGSDHGGSEGELSRLVALPQEQLRDMSNQNEGLPHGQGVWDAINGDEVVKLREDKMAPAAIY